MITNTMTTMLDRMGEALTAGRIANFAPGAPFRNRNVPGQYDYRAHGRPDLCCAIGAALTERQRDSLNALNLLDATVNEIIGPLNLTGALDDEDLESLDLLQHLHDYATAPLRDALWRVQMHPLSRHLTAHFGSRRAVDIEVMREALRAAREIATGGCP